MKKKKDEYRKVKSTERKPYDYTALISEETSNDEIVEIIKRCEEDKKSKIKVEAEIRQIGELSVNDSLDFGSYEEKSNEEEEEDEDEDED